MMKQSFKIVKIGFTFLLLWVNVVDCLVYNVLGVSYVKDNQPGGVCYTLLMNVLHLKTKARAYRCHDELVINYNLQ